MQRRSRPTGAGWLTIGGIAAGVVNYAYTLVMTHYLATSQFAVFAGAQALVLIVGIVSRAGVPWVLARETAAATAHPDHARMRQAVSFAFWANIPVGLLAAALTGGIVLSFGSPVDALLVAATSLILCIGSTGLGFLQGQGRTGVLAAIVVCEVVVKFSVGLTVVSVSHPAAAGALAGALAGAVVPLLSLVPLVRFLGPPRSLHTDLALWRSAGRIGLLQVGVGVITSLDTILAASLPRLRGVGAAYQVASTLGKVPLFVSSAVSTAVFPTLTVGDAPRARVHALRIYSVVSGFVWLVLITAPADLVLQLFPTDYGSFVRWLSYTAPLGVALGLLNVLTTFVQSRSNAAEDGGASGVTHMGAAIVLTAAAMLAGAGFGGVRGLAVGALCGSWAAAALFSSINTERRAVVALAQTSWNPIRRVVVAVALVLVIVLAQPIPLVWLLLVVAVGLLVTVQAFPEFRAPFDRRSRQATPTRRGLGSS